MKSPFVMQLGPIVFKVWSEDGLFLAHCLTTDTMAQGTTAEEAVTNMRDAINDEIDFHVEHGTLSDLFSHPAPKEDWDLYEKQAKDDVDCKTVHLLQEIPTAVIREVAEIGTRLVERQQDLVTQ